MVAAIPAGGRLALETLAAARRWARVRAKLRRLLDSKSAPAADVNQARGAYSKASDELELSVRRLEKFMVANGQKMSMKRATPPFPWQQMLGAVAAGLQAVDTAINPQNHAAPTPVASQVIDVEPE